MSAPIATARADEIDALWERFWEELTPEELEEVAAFFAATIDEEE